MGWRSWTLTKIAVFGVCFAATFLLLSVVVLYFYNRPKSWDAKALTVQWTDVKYLSGENERITGFLFEYGVNNNTGQDYELRKDGTTIMVSDRKDSLVPADFNYSIGRDTFFLPAHQTSLVELHLDGGCSQNASGDWFEQNAGPWTRYRPQNERIERTDKELGKIIKSQYPVYNDIPDKDLGESIKKKRPDLWEKFRYRKSDIFDQVDAEARNRTAGKSANGEDARKCFDQYTRDMSGIVLFDPAAKYRINLPKPSRAKW